MGESPAATLVGYSQALDRLRAMEARLGEDYLGAVNNGADDARAGRLRREWMEVGDQLRKAETTASDLSKRNRESNAGEFLSKARVCEVLDELHGRIPRRLKADMGAAYRDAIRATRTGEAGWVQFVDELVNTACRRLVDSRFADLAA